MKSESTTSESKLTFDVPDGSFREFLKNRQITSQTQPGGPRRRSDQRNDVQQSVHLALESAPKEHDRKSNQNKGDHEPEAQSLDAVKSALGDILRELELELGERWLGETTTAFNTALRFHVRRGTGAEGTTQYNKVVDLSNATRYEVLETPAEDYLLKVLTDTCPADSGMHSTERRALLLLELGRACWALWDASLCYKTINSARGAAEKFAAHSDRPSVALLKAASAWLEMTYQDSLLFKETNRGYPDHVRDALKKALSKLDQVEDQLAGALKAIPADDHIELKEALTSALTQCQANKTFYHAINEVTLCLESFESWIQKEPRVGSRTPPLAVGDGDERMGRMAEKVDRVLSNLDQVAGELRKDEATATTASRFEPWRQLLVNLAETLRLRGPDDTATAKVFVPQRVEVRYCFPFAVDFAHGKHRQDDVENYIKSLDPQLVPYAAALGSVPQGLDAGADPTGSLARSLKDHLSDLFPEYESSTPAVSQLPVSAFWLGSGDGIYGGRKVVLPEVTIGGKRHSAWLELSRMGNHSFCVAPNEALEATGKRAKPPYPHDVYRTLRAGTPWALGEEVKVKSGATTARWENMHLFAQDVVLATARALCGTEKPDGVKIAQIPPYVPGNLHEVVKVQTDVPIAAPGLVPIETVLGAQVLLSSANLVASTLDEWLRAPAPMTTPNGAGKQGVSNYARTLPLPILGFAGDWFAQTGDMTVLGIVAVPDWLWGAYLEVAQFAATWVPRLEMWSTRLEEVIRTAHDGDHRSQKSSEALRMVDQSIRRQTSELRSSQLCQSQLHRRFLDVFLDESGVLTLANDLEAQLVAAERLADWYDERRRSSSEDARNFLLVLIGLFSVFGLASYLSLANGTTREGKYRGFFGLLNSDPSVEVHIVLGVFLLLVLVCVWLLFLRGRMLTKMRQLRNWLSGKART